MTTVSPSLSRREKMLAFGGILVVLFLTSLNLTVVGTALPRIIAELEGFKLYAWAFTAYSLTSTVSLPIYGKLSDIYGRKRILLFGILLFSVSSALGGFAQNMPQLILLRALQGLGGGALTSMAFSAIGDIFTPRERGAYQGFTGAVFGLSSVLGPLAGGLITDTLGWRWVFFVNVPIALVALGCGGLDDLHHAVHDRLTPQRFLGNLVGSVSYTQLTVPPDPNDAEQRFCG